MVKQKRKTKQSKNRKQKTKQNKGKKEEIHVIDSNIDLTSMQFSLFWKQHKIKCLNNRLLKTYF
jgi:ubiquinone/menaquinone biosynthesis C-methylase UbiE